MKEEELKEVTERELSKDEEEENYHQFNKKKIVCRHPKHSIKLFVCCRKNLPKSF
jgi:hypothetical protein